MMEFTFKGEKKQIPAMLEELDTKQYIEFLKLSSIMSKGYLTPGVFRVKWISVLLGLKTDYTQYVPEIVAEVDAQLDKLDGFFDYEPMPDGDGRVVTPRLKTGRQMMKEYAGWVGPGDMLDGMTFGNFTDCLTIMTMIKTAIDEGEEEETIAEMYQEMTRKIYRPAVPVPETEKLVPPPLLVLHAVNLFSSVWMQIVSEPVYINGQTVNFSILFSGMQNNGRAGLDDKTGWQGITFEVAGSGVFGRVQDVNATPFWDVLLYLYKCKFEYMHNLNTASRKSH
ncbi:hypothetical protein [Prevotella sp. E13-27]|uniref:hypothetical protein n=1 Tax=Prevotella sp. E13-27 TaxID=2938122 RepID=UPI00200A9CF7|nr:hypothetical protein [Prevotella sp. E13-27]MCK8622636.1 hypothetical protein [Prevotella sp. E13-27]